MNQQAINRALAEGDPQMIGFLAGHYMRDKIARYDLASNCRWCEGAVDSIGFCNCYPVRAVAGGTRDGEGGESWTHWALFNRADVEAFAAKRDLDLADAEQLDALGGLLTWWGGSRAVHAGQAFSHDPETRLTRTRVLVTCWGAFDV